VRQHRSLRGMTISTPLDLLVFGVLLEQEPQEAL
jgi:hypothetical protein